jgi:hypothetical protein
MNREDKASRLAAPLDEAWWLNRQVDKSAPPPVEQPILAPYSRTRPGFEVGVAAASRGQAGYFKDIGDGCYELCLWNIWRKEGDPADSDPQKQAINEMQKALGQVEEEDRFIRIQIACLARCYWTFPANVDLVLRGIATGRAGLDVGISCEPPWTGMRAELLRRRMPSAIDDRPIVAQLHHQQGLDPRDDPRQDLLRAYMNILVWWTAEGHLGCLKGDLAAHADLAETIYRRLGEPDRAKRLCVQRLLWHLSIPAVPGLPREGRMERLSELGRLHDDEIRQALGEHGDRICRLIDRNYDNGSCHHAFVRHIDRQIAEIGAGRPVSLPGAGKERKRVHSAIVDYVHALGSWLVGRAPQEAATIWPEGRDTVDHVYQVLGDGNPRKRWLAACLWKKLQEDRVHGGRGALDEDPERFAIPQDALRL